MKNRDVNFTFGLITLLLFVAVYGYGIFTDGMFFDGIVYASVANNLAHHIGTFWEMQYTTTLHTSYHEQPPLAFFIQSLFFKVLGDSIYVERVYCLFAALLSMFLIKGLWEQLTEKGNRQYWIPLLLWLAIPLNSWTIQNNLMEVTMGAFDLCAIYLILKGCKKDSLIFFALGGLFTVLAAFSKGMQGLFPLAAPVVYWVIYRSVYFSRMFLQTIVVSAIPMLAVFTLYLYPPAHQSIQLYIERRLGGTFNHVQDTTRSHFYLLYKLAMELLVPLILYGLSRVFARHYTVKDPDNTKAILFLLGVGLSASLPLMVTLEQRPFYLTTSFPYFALAIGLIALPAINGIIEKLKTKDVTLINKALLGLIVIAIVLVSINAKNPKREHALIGDVRLISTVIPKRTTISIAPDLEARWSYHAYFMRYANISLDAHNQHEYFISTMDGPAPFDSCYRKIDLPLEKFMLYKCELR